MSAAGTKVNVEGNIFLDTAPIIYYIEKSSSFFKTLQPLFERNKVGQVQFLTSTLTIIEVLTLPLKTKRSDLVKEYEDILLNSPFLRLIPCDQQVARKAAELRSTYQLKTPDAIQKASAIVAGAKCVISNDIDLKRVKEIQVITLSDL